jgi:histidinol phosphatase-like enzyme (inositol monophosphatase family)
MDDDFVQMQSYMNFANELADLARPIARAHFRTSIDIESKADQSPVTIADKAIERRLREEIYEVYPDHGVLGEEEGGDFARQLTWVIDPIDGTKSFITGIPLFGTLISLAFRGRPILGVVDMPALGERWHAFGGQTWFGDQTAKSSNRPLASARLLATSPDMFAGTASTQFANLSRVVGMRRFGGDCYAYGLLASGHVDLVVESGLHIYDVMALVPVVQGAGGVITDWHGREISPDFDGNLLAAANPRLHVEALAALSASGPSVGI